MLIDTRIITALAIVAATSVLLARRLRRPPRHLAPVIDLALFRLRSYRLANAATAVFGVVFAAFFFAFVLFATQVWGYPATTAGLLVAPGPLIAAVVGVMRGRVVDARGHRAVLLPGALLFAAGAAWLLVLARPDPDLLTVWWPSVALIGAGVGLVLPSLSSAAVIDLPPAAAAGGAAVNQTIRQIGSVLGVALVVALLARGGSGDGPSFLDGFRSVFALMIGGGLATAAIAARLERGAAA